MVCREMITVGVRPGGIELNPLQVFRLRYQLGVGVSENDIRAADLLPGRLLHGGVFKAASAAQPLQIGLVGLLKGHDDQNLHIFPLFHFCFIISQKIDDDKARHRRQN